MTENTEQPDDDVQNEEQQQEDKPNYSGPSSFRRYLLYFALLSVSILATVASWILVSNYVSWSIPPQVKLATTSFFVASLLAVLPSILICSWLWNPRPYFVVDIDAEQSYFSLYRLSEQAFKELEFTEGEPFTLGPKVISVRRYDIETNTARGTWRGSKDDLELLRKLEEVEELKTTFENLAKRGLSYRSKYTKIIYDSVERVTTAFLLDFEGKVFKSGQAINDAVEDSIDANLPDLEPEADADFDLQDSLELLDQHDRSINFDDLDSEPFDRPTSNGDTEDLNPRSTRWSK